MPSDTSLGYTDRGYRAPRHPSRGPSPVYYQTPNDRDVPPVPSLYQSYHPAVEQARHLDRSIKGSASSGSINMRTDSDTPSSDMVQPPTPRDGMSVGVLASPQGNRMRKGTTTRIMKEPVLNAPLYYDYSEQFEHDEFAESEPEPMPTGLVNNVKTVFHERNDTGVSCRAAKATTAGQSDNIESYDVPGVAELPASPVGRRITRNLVRQGLLYNSSSTGDTVPSTNSATVDNVKPEHLSHDQPANGPVDEEMSKLSTLSTRPVEQRHSILSQTGSSVLNSSTLEFAVRYSIPAITGTGLDTTQPESETASTSPGSPDKSTGGMSELLAGYQDTDSKQESIVSPKPEKMHKTELGTANASEKNSLYAQKSSDELSFKSCTDVPEPGTSESVMSQSNKDENSEPEKDVSGVSPDTPLDVKDPDARSFQTCKDISTPVSPNPVPPSSLPSAALEVGLEDKRPAPLSSPLQMMGEVAATHKPKSSIASKFRKSSRPSVKQGSVSISGSSCTLSTPPAVPPRESSASTEAQRHNAVGSYLMRRVVPHFSKGRKEVSNDKNKVVQNSMDTAAGQTLQPDDNLPEPVAVLGNSPAVKEVSKTVPTEQNVEERQPPSGVADRYCHAQGLHVNRVTLPAQHFHSFSSPGTAFPGGSSVYSPQDISSKGRAQSSPANSRRERQSTTHLSWAGRKPFGVPSTSASEPRLPLPSVQEDTTTNLRLSAYKYNAPQRYLHDLKEDSHEDSSLNTSASNLKNSHFRFPHGCGVGMRTSVDEVVVLSRRSSARSGRGSAIDHARNLPSLEFIQANLFELFRDALVDARFSRGGPQLDVADAEEGSPQLSALNKCDCLQARDLVKGVVQAERGGESTQSAGVIGFSRLSRTYTPDGLIAEIDRVSVPSVTQLTQRVTEMLPSLGLADQQTRGESGSIGEFPEEEEIMEQAIEEIHLVHAPTQKRSSARLRPIRGSSALLIMDDDVYEELTSRERGKGISGAGQSTSTRESDIGGGEAGSRDKGKGKAITTTLTHHLSPVAELRTPSPTVLRPETRRSKSVEALAASFESGLFFTGSPRSFVSTTTATDTRPWNFDKNYPWATTTNPVVDISLPLPLAQKQSPRPGPSHLRNTLSDATTSTFTSVGAPLGSPAGNTAGSNAHRQFHRNSFFERNGDQAHAVGERYPTSALSPPTAIFRDNLSTCETSDDEDFTNSRKANKLTLRKRFSSAARSTTLTHNTPRAARSRVNPAELASPASDHEDSSSSLQDRAGEAHAFTSNRHTFRDAQGMQISAYHRRRIVDSIKRWWHKGGELIRTISRRNHRRDVSDSASH
jgi:serine/arginine repetitive matrix protein 2